MKSSTDTVRERERKKSRPRERERKCTDRKWELWCPHTALNTTMMLEKVSSVQHDSYRWAQSKHAAHKACR